jgi:hypothetical protein
VHDRVGLANVGEELVAEAFTLCCSLDEAGDVDELHDGGDSLLRLHDLGDHDQPRIGHFDHPNVWFDCAERIVRRFRARGGERVEQGGLSDIRKPDNSQFQHGQS